NLGALLAELVEAAVPLAERRGLTLRTQRVGGLPGTVFDAHITQIIIAHPLSKPPQFTPQGGEGGGRGGMEKEIAYFEVADDGPGIPANQLERIFERFHQVDGSASREHGGTGLGLALARELARLHGGNVAVRSRLGEGSTFRVELPRDP